MREQPLPVLQAREGGAVGRRDIVELKGLVGRFRREVEGEVPIAIHRKEGDPDGTLGGRRFTSRFTSYVDHPPRALTVLREHRKEHPVTGGLLWDVVVWRVPLSEALQFNGIRDRSAGIRAMLSALRKLTKELDRR